MRKIYYSSTETANAWSRGGYFTLLRIWELFGWRIVLWRKPKNEN